MSSKRTVGGGEVGEERGTDPRGPCGNFSSGRCAKDRL